MSWLFTWFILELTQVAAATDLSEPQAFKEVSLQIMIIKHSLFARFFSEELHHIQVLTFDMNI